MKTLVKAVIFGTVAVGTFEVLRRTGVAQKVADKVADKAMDLFVHAAMEDNTTDEAETVWATGS